MQVYSWPCSKFETKDNEILTENKSEPFLFYLLTLLIPDQPFTP